MSAKPSDVTLLDDPVARELLDSTQVARLAYTWTDGTPRVVPLWFHYDGEVITIRSPAGRGPSAEGPGAPGPSGGGDHNGRRTSVAI